jgi:hypothetical protein
MQENNRVAGTDTDVGHATVKYVDVFLARRGGTALLMFADCISRSPSAII